MVDKARETVQARGIFGQLIFIAPEHEMVVVKLSSYPEFTNLNYAKNTLAAISAIAAELK